MYENENTINDAADLFPRFSNSKISAVYLALIKQWYNLFNNFKISHNMHENTSLDTSSSKVNTPKSKVKVLGSNARQEGRVQG